MTSSQLWKKKSAWNRHSVSTMYWNSLKKNFPCLQKKTHELCILVVTRQLILKFWQVIRNTLKHRGIGMSEIGNIKFENFQLKSYPVPLNQFDCSLETIKTIVRYFTFILMCLISFLLILILAYSFLMNSIVYLLDSWILPLL